MIIEVNVDSLVGPTHHFGGLGVGNVASITHREKVSNPQQAALQGLAKAALVASFGIPQYMWLPPLRPRIDMLSQAGFRGSLREQLETTAKLAPRLLSAVFSSSFMWTANAATVTPSGDAIDGIARITPANLISSWHRAPEASERLVDLERLCGAAPSMVVNEPLPRIVPLRDEGAANHMRLSDRSGERAINLFVYGEDEAEPLPTGEFPARHTRATCEAIARLHLLRPEHVFYLQQHPAAIAAGVFHNDVIATSHEDLFLYHESAYWEAERTLQQVQDAFLQRTGQPLKAVCISEAELPFASAVRSYFFNSQILSPRGAGELPQMVMLCPSQCETDPHVQQLIQRLLADSSIPIEEVRYVQLAESMANGGGPACLRLRVPVKDEQQAMFNNRLRLDESLRDRLEQVILQWYPTSVSIANFTDQEFIAQAEQAVQSLLSS